MTRAQAATDLADTKEMWWYTSSQFKELKLAPCGVETKGAAQKPGIPGPHKIYGTRCFMRVSDPLFMNEAQRSTPESHIALAETAVALWHMVKGCLVRPAQLEAHLTKLNRRDTALLLGEIKPIIARAFPGATPGQVVPTSGEEMARFLVALYNHNKIKPPLSALADEPMAVSTGNGGAGAGTGSRTTDSISVLSTGDCHANEAQGGNIMAGYHTCHLCTIRAPDFHAKALDVLGDL